MIAKKSSIHDLINPCQISETNRHQAFQESESSSYTQNGEIRFNLPLETIDLTQSYIDGIIQLNTTDAEVPSIYTLDLTGATTGTFKLGYKGYYTASLNWNVSIADMETALENLYSVGKSFYSVSVAGGFPVYTITISNFDGLGFSFDDNASLVFQQFSVFTGITSVFPYLRQTQVGVLAYPRLEYLAPIISQVRVNVNSNQIITIDDSNILSSIFTLMRPIDQIYPGYVLYNQNVNGYHSANQFRFRFNLDFIDFFKKILPLNEMNTQIKLYLQLESNNIALIQSTTGGGIYTITNPRLHYHRIDLSPMEIMRIEKTIFKEGGLVIPFKNWQRFASDIPNGTTDKNILFNPAVRNLLGIMFVMIDNSYKSDPTNSRKLSTYLRNRVGAYRIKLGSKYFPLDQIDSLTSGSDQVEEITELEHFLEMMPDSFDLCRQLYLNYGGGTINGNLPSDQIFTNQLGYLSNMTFVGAVSCSDVPMNQYGHVCLTDSLSGQDVSKLTNCILELKNLNLANDCTIYVYSYHQDFLIVKEGDVRYVK